MMRSENLNQPDWEGGVRREPMGGGWEGLSVRLLLPCGEDGLSALGGRGDHNKKEAGIFTTGFIFLLN